MLIQEALKQSDKIRRACFESKRFIEKDECGRIFNGYGAFPLFTEEDLNANDWEVYREPPELKVGKCYRTRHGKKALVVKEYSKSIGGDDRFLVAVVDNAGLLTYGENGHYYDDDEVNLDLVSEWEDSND